MDLQGSQTEKNLQEAYTGESQAVNKYCFFAKEAKEAGYIHLSKVYEETASNEHEHAKIWFKYLHGGDISDTETNLNDCIEHESHEHSNMYPTFAEEAEKEGFTEIAQAFRNVAKIEGMHKERFEALLQEIEDKTVFEKEYDQEWECSKCGFISNSKEAPQKCPFCGHPQGYFFEHCQNY